jgi:hypothetical protein
MDFPTYEITIEGRSPLLMHHDDLDWSDQMAAWLLVGNNKISSKAGDDRAPAWKWIGSLYHDDQFVGLDQECIMRCLMDGGAAVPDPKSNSSKKTLKSETQSGIIPIDTLWPLTIDGRNVEFGPIAKMVKQDDFAKHQLFARQAGFELWAKRATIGASKHVRVRPRFDKWQVRGKLEVVEERLTLEVLQRILDYCGHYKGLGDWRPGSPKRPGPFGRFSARIVAV